MLTASGPLCQRGIADRLLVVKRNVTAMLNRVERGGLANREPDPDSGRSSDVTGAARIVADTFAALSAAESSQLAEMMRRVLVPPPTDR